MKISMFKNFFAIALLSAVATAVLFTNAGCRAKKVQSKAWHIPDDEYAFFEYYQLNEGKAIEGEAPPAMRIDGPSYSFSPTDGELSSYLTPSFSKDSIIAVLGRGLVLRGTEGGGLHNRLIPINQLPFTEEAITIEGITAESLLFDLKGEKVTLAKGQEWKKVMQSVDTLFLPDGNVVIEKTKTQRVIFHGLLKKDKLIFR